MIYILILLIPVAFFVGKYVGESSINPEKEETPEEKRFKDLNDKTPAFLRKENNQTKPNK